MRYTKKKHFRVKKIHTQNKKYIIYNTCKWEENKTVERVKEKRVLKNSFTRYVENMKHEKV